MQHKEEPDPQEAGGYTPKLCRVPFLCFPSPPFSSLSSPPSCFPSRTWLWLIMVLVYVRVDVEHLAQRPQNLMVKQHKPKQSKQSVNCQQWEAKGNKETVLIKMAQLDGIAH